MTSQHRELVPLTVYIPPAAKAEAERRADDATISTGTMLRLILLGKQPPLSSYST